MVWASVILQFQSKQTIRCCQLERKPCCMRCQQCRADIIIHQRRGAPWASCAGQQRVWIQPMHQ